MKSKIDKQKENTTPVTEEQILVMKNKFYHSGMEIQPGDIILFGLLEEEDDEDSHDDWYPDFSSHKMENIKRFKITLINFHESELDKLYIINHEWEERSREYGLSTDVIPRLKNK